MEILRTIRMACLGLFLTACQFQQVPPTDPDAPPVCTGAHAWGDDDDDGIGYRLPTTAIRVDNTSGYALDLNTLGGSSLKFSPDAGDFTIPMKRVDEPGNGWLGQARVWVNNYTLIVQRAEVLMNFGYPEMANEAYATHVGCMEVLHTAGLAHQVARDSCMDDCSKTAGWGACMRDQDKRTPNPHDFEQLEVLYGADVEPPVLCFSAELTLLTFMFPAPGADHADNHP